MIPKRNCALRISQQPIDFAASAEIPDVVQSESPVNNMRDEGVSIFEKMSDTISTDMDHSSAAIEPPSMYPSEPAAITHHPQIIDSDVEDLRLILAFVAMTQYWCLALALRTSTQSRSAF